MGRKVVVFPALAGAPLEQTPPFFLVWLPRHTQPLCLQLQLRHILATALEG